MDSMKRWFPLISVVVGICLVVAAVGLVELGFRLHKRFASPKESAARGTSHHGDYVGTGYFVNDPVLGFKPKPDVRVSSTMTYSDGQVIYDVHYTTDKFSRRVTPIDSSASRDRFAIFFGCSITLGEGLNDDETLPYFLGKYAPRYRPYNYGFCGYGPQEMLAKLQQPSFAEEIGEKRGVAICVTAHIARAIGSSYVYSGWGWDMPYYHFDQDGKLVRDGTFTTGRPFLSLIYMLMGRSEIGATLRLRHPFRTTEEHIKLTAKIVEESALVFKQQFTDSDFCFVNLPGFDGPGEMAVVAALRKSGIKVLDFSDRKEFEAKEYHIQGDGHPSVKYNKELARLIVDRLGLDRDTSTQASSK